MTTAELTTTEEKLVDYLQDAHALESNVLEMLQSLARTTPDQELTTLFEQHMEETREHQHKLQTCLEGLGADTSTRKELQTVVGGMGKALVDMVRGDKAGKNGRDAYVSESLEIASYNLLERLATKAGHQEIAEVARQIRSDEERMRDALDGHWDRFTELTLRENES